MTWTLEEQKAHRKDLVAALRSGKYKQGTARLRARATNNFCCLGVAEDLRGCEWKEAGAYAGYSIQHTANDDPAFWQRAILTEKGRDYYGFTNEIGSFIVNNEYDSLIEMNDNGMTFSQIADIIEHEPDGLFVN